MCGWTSGGMDAIRDGAGTQNNWWDPQSSLQGEYTAFNWITLWLTWGVIAKGFRPGYFAVGALATAPLQQQQPMLVVHPLWDRFFHAKLQRAPAKYGWSIVTILFISYAHDHDCKWSSSKSKSTPCSLRIRICNTLPQWWWYVDVLKMPLLTVQHEGNRKLFYVLIELARLSVNHLNQNLIYYCSVGQITNSNVNNLSES